MDIFDNLATAFGDFLNNPVVQLVLRAIGLFFIALWLATAFWAYRDLQSRTTNPVAPYLAAALIILFTPILFPFGVLLYRILRPGTTVADQNERALAEEAMMVEIESQPHCANCARQVHADWIICPTCRNRLRRVCPNCSRLVELDWSLCAWCGKDFERPEVLRDPVPTPVGGRPVPVMAQAEPAGIAARSGIRERLPADSSATGTAATTNR
jgi:RNA polymerase subunit RPABC4/transcription elongation factor Spt4